jgi:hypothetical protein
MNSKSKPAGTLSFAADLGEGSQLLMSLFNYTKRHCWPCDTDDGSRSVGWKAPHMSAAGTKETKFNRVNQSRHTISEC